MKQLCHVFDVHRSSYRTWRDRPKSLPLEEKRLEWSAALRPGNNEIRIPVRAQQAGTWRLVARARATGLATASETRLVVTRS